MDVSIKSLTSFDSNFVQSMRNGIFYFTTLILISFLSCKEPEVKSCNHILSPLSFSLEDTTIQNFMISNIDNNKIWIFENKTKNVLELNINTKQQKYLDFGLIPHNSTVRISQSYFDHVDSILWIGGQPQQLVSIDLRSNKKQEFPLKNVVRIIDRTDATYFVSYHGFYSFDKVSKDFGKVPNIPDTLFIQSSFIIDSNSISLNTDYSYNFTTKEVKKGVVIQNKNYNLVWTQIRETCGKLIWKIDNDVRSIHNQKVFIFPYNFDNFSDLMFFNGEYWYQDQTHFHSFNPETKVIKNFRYKIPRLTHYQTNYYVDEEFIWVSSYGDVMLISLKDNKHFILPKDKAVSHLKTLVDDCNVLSLYKGKFTVLSKNDFVQQCIPFDYVNYENWLKYFDFVLDSLALLQDSDELSSLNKLNFLKGRFGSFNHVELRQKLAQMDYSAFQNVEYDFPKGLETCYKNTSLPIKHRKSCITKLIEQYGFNSNFTSIINLDNNFIELFGPPNPEVDYYYLAKVNAVKNYYRQIDSLNKVKLPIDSLSYFKIMAFESNIIGPWYCHQGCGGCDYTIIYDKLIKFQREFQESELNDDAALYMIDHDHLYDYQFEEESNDLLRKYIDEYELFLIEFPDSGFRSNIQYEIFMKWYSIKIKRR